MFPSVDGNPAAVCSEVRVVDALAVHASGASLFEYLGSPVVQTDASGASVVRRAGS